MNIEDIINKGTILKCICGSRGYGTSLPDSDIDYRGIAIAPIEYYFGTKQFEQHETKDPDSVIYNIRKWFSLAIQNNPNVLELIYSDPKFIVKQTHFGTMLINRRAAFLSKLVFKTYCGYALAQIHRMRNHREWINNPIDKPNRIDYNLPEIPKYPEHIIKGFVGVKFTDLKDDIHAYISKELGYLAKLEQYRRYQTWLRERNPERAESERRVGYDCYHEKTEFLTESGWKHFSDINETDKLATINIKTNHLEYQNYIDKFYSNFNGDMYNLYGYRTDVLVTPNHNMLIRKVERVSKKKYDWELKYISNMPDTFDVLNTINPKLRNFKDPIMNTGIYSLQDYLKLMGFYLSDGTTNFRNGKVKCIRITQMKPIMNSILTCINKKYNNIKHYKYNKKDRILLDHVWTIPRLESELLYNDCGHMSRIKRIPRWVFKLSKRHMTTLIKAMLIGDGSKRPNGILVYNSNNRNLASDIQELSFLCGYETWLLGDNFNQDNPIYQVHIDINPNKTKECIRNQNIKKINSDCNIVCFSVPNSTLITRYNGYIGIHGNCKHAMHTIRLLKTGIEILSKGELHVLRPDVDELMEIRLGQLNYEQFMAKFNHYDEEIKLAYANSNLPEHPDYEELNRLLVHIITNFELRGVNKYESKASI